MAAAPASASAASDRPFVASLSPSPFPIVNLAFKSKAWRRARPELERERSTFYLSLKSKKDSFTVHSSPPLLPPSPPFYANLVN